MTTPYRNETEALRERKAALEQETSRLREQRAQLDWLGAREQEIQKELATIDEKLAGGARRKLPMLDQVSVASPCSADWNEMLGDDKVRFCVSCEKNVYNISAMPKDEAEALIAARSEGELCIRFYQRADGTIMTADCPVGVKRKRRKKLALAVAGAGALAFGAVTSLQRAGRHNMGAMEPIAVQPTYVEPQVESIPVEQADPDPAPPHVMGRMANPHLKEPTKPITPPRPKAPPPRTR